MRIAFYTLGCKVNQYETEALKGMFVERGWTVAEADESADAFVVNSCTVTALGDKKARQAIRHFKRNNPAALVALTGCFPQAFPEIQNQLPEADVITGATNRAALPDLLTQALTTGQRIVQINPHQTGEPFEPMQIHNFSRRTRAFVKIQDGCDRYCTYCIIPTARGRVRSNPPELLQKQLQELAQKGYREVVLVGINLSAYGRDLQNVRLLDAVRLACEVDGIDRVRLGSLEPELLTDEDIAAFSQLPKFCPQFHLSLQSGSDNVLRRMNRHYDTAAYRRIIAAIRRSFTNPSITTDVMVGFPGESAEEFAESAAFVQEMGFARVHIFPYSIRPGTRAAQMDGQLSHAQKQARAKEMALAAAKGQQAFLQRQIGTTQQVLFETQTGSRAHGYTKNYLPVFVKSKADLCGQIKYVTITACQNDKGLGELSETCSTEQI